MLCSGTLSRLIIVAIFCGWIGMIALEGRQARGKLHQTPRGFFRASIRGLLDGYPRRWSLWRPQRVGRRATVGTTLSNPREVLDSRCAFWMNCFQWAAAPAKGTELLGQFHSNLKCLIGFPIQFSLVMDKPSGVAILERHVTWCSRDKQ